MKQNVNCDLKTQRKKIVPKCLPNQKSFFMNLTEREREIGKRKKRLPTNEMISCVSQ